MSKLLWKILLITPAVLSATLMLFAGTVRAADGSSQLVGDIQPTANVAQPQLAEAQTQKTQSIASAAIPTAPTAINESVFSTADKQASVNQTAAKLEVPAPVAVNPSQVNLTAPDTTASAPISVTPAAAPEVAQAAPAPADTNVLDQINRYSREGNSNTQDQVTNVSQLRDVSPGDWAYEALRSLVERYGCIAGYPDGTYKGRQALTRYEFAAGLNACLNQVERLIASSTADFVRRSDLETLQRLVNEFRTELTTLGARVDKLEGRVAFLEDRQFSTTTKLQGEAIFAVTDEFGQPFENNTVFQDRVRLRLNTSFTGRDLLVTRLAAGNAQSFRKVGGPFNSIAGGSGEGTQTFEIGQEGTNQVNVDWLGYYFNFGSSKVYVAATGGAHSDYVPTLNPYFDDGDGGNGALSTFATQNPIYRIGGGAGAAISLGVGPLQSILGPSTLTLGYLAGPSANDPSEKNGLFDGNFAALGQLNFNLGDRIGIGATYVHAYKTTGTDIFNFGNGSTGDNGRVVGSFLANRPSALLGAGNGVPTVTNSYGGEAAFRFTDKISISGFATYTQAILLGQGRADIWTYGGGLAFSDFGKKGNVLGLFAGVEPTLKGATPGIRAAAAAAGNNFSRDNSWHFEGFYKYQVTDNISVTPGVIWLTAPGQRDANTDAIIGTLRTTFTF